MASINPENYGKLEEIIDFFTFRNQGGIRIPKYRREKAFSHCVDIIIESIDFNLYASTKTLPDKQYYGTATLVLQDCLIPEVPLIFPRQRVWFDRNYSAFSSWQAEKVFWENYQFHRKNDLSLASIMGALEIPYDELEPILAPMNFVELPLREVRVKCIPNTQFRIEYSQIQPVSYSDPFGNERTGESQQIDGDKDLGLPPDGIQPKRNSPQDPWKGNKPALGASPESGFLLPLDNLTEEDPSNQGDEPSALKYWIRAQSRIRRPEYEGGCSTVRVETFYIELLNENIEYETRQNGTPIPSGCDGRTSVQRQIRLTGGEWFLIGFDDSDSPMTFDKQSGLEVPPYSLVFE